jgi:YbgC/YbaW family acyl-CoA thioester hydrolase
VVHVNNGIYAHFLEDAALEVVAAAGWPLQRMLEHGGAMRVQSLDIEYFADAQPGDELEVKTWQLSAICSDILPRAAVFLQSIQRGPMEILRAKSEWVWRRRATVLGAPPL